MHKIWAVILLCLLGAGLDGPGAAAAGMVESVVAPTEGAKVPMKILTCDEAPTNYLDNGKVTGITTDIVRELMRRTGTQGTIKLLPWARAYSEAMEEANVVLFTAGRTEQREELFQWVGPLFLKRWVVYGRSDSKLQPQSLEELKSVRRIAVLRNDARAQFFKKRGFENIVEVDSHEQALMMVMLGRADLWPSSDIEAPVIVSRAGYAIDQLKPVYVLKEIRPHIIISRKTPKAIVENWQQALTDMAEDGTLEKIADLWSQRLKAHFVVENGMLVLQHE